MKKNCRAKIDSLYRSLIIRSKLPETSKYYGVFFLLIANVVIILLKRSMLSLGKKRIYFFNSEYGPSHGSQWEFFIEFNENLNGPLNAISNARASQIHPAPEALSSPQGAVATCVFRLSGI